MTKTVKLLAALFALLLVAAACSNDDGTTTETGDDSSSDAATSDGSGSDDSGSDDGAADDTDSGSGDGAAEGDDDAMDDDADSGSDDDADDDADSGDDDADAATTEDDDTADEGATPAAGSITVTAVSFTDSTVTVRNDGAEAVDFSGHFTCNRPAYNDMPAVVLEPGATLDVDVSSLDIRASGGEFGLYSSRSFDSADAMIAYVQWGGPGNGRASVAVDAGLIADGEFVDNGGEDITIG